jgi:hypothetical protein
MRFESPCVEFGFHGPVLARGLRIVGGGGGTQTVRFPEDFSPWAGWDSAAAEAAAAADAAAAAAGAGVQDGGRAGGGAATADGAAVGGWSVVYYTQRSRSDDFFSTPVGRRGLPGPSTGLGSLGCDLDKANDSLLGCSSEDCGCGGSGNGGAGSGGGGGGGGGAVELQVAWDSACWADGPAAAVAATLCAVEAALEGPDGKERAAERAYVLILSKPV